MGIRVALNHRTCYRYPKPVWLSPHVVRLRPAPHCRTTITSYSLKVTPADHFVNWQQDPYSNRLARLVFPKKTTEFSVEVDLIADQIRQRERLIDDIRPPHRIRPQLTRRTHIRLRRPIRPSRSHQHFAIHSVSFLSTTPLVQ